MIEFRKISRRLRIRPNFSDPDRNKQVSTCHIPHEVPKLSIGGGGVLCHRPLSSSEYGASRPRTKKVRLLRHSTQSFKLLLREAGLRTGVFSSWSTIAPAAELNRLIYSGVSSLKLSTRLTKGLNFSATKFSVKSQRAGQKIGPVFLISFLHNQTDRKSVAALSSTGW